jgi:hypothetical protein
MITTVLFSQNIDVEAGLHLVCVIAAVSMFMPVCCRDSRLTEIQFHVLGFSSHINACLRRPEPGSGH